MDAISHRGEPALLNYAGYAWEFLRRNPHYRRAFERSRSVQNKPTLTQTGGSLLRIKAVSKAAEKWGLQYFSDPDEDYLTSHVFWSHEAFNRVLPIEFEPVTASTLTEKSIQFSDIHCTKQHLLSHDGMRETVLKSPTFWIQLYGRPLSPTKENGSIIIRLNGRKGLRKRLETLQVLAELRDKKPESPLILVQNNMFRNLQFYLNILDLKPLGLSYREMSKRLIGEQRTRSDWDSNGCSLKSKMVRGAARAERLMQKDYLKLLRR